MVGVGIGGLSLAGMCHLLEHMMQLLESREAEGHGRQSAGIKLPIGGRDGNVADHVGAKLNDTAATEVGDVGDAHEREGAPAEGVARVGDGDRLVR